MSGQPHRNFAVRKFLALPHAASWKRKFSGWVNVISLALRTELRINAERLGPSAGGRWPFQGQLRRRPEPTTEDWNSHGSVPINFRAPNCGAHGACSREFFDRKIAVRLARYCRRHAERRNDLRLL